jgi:hypothetical protein
MNYFLIVYDTAAGEILELKRFGALQRALALSKRFAREFAERDRRNIEVVLLSAESEDELRRTHSRYFESSAELAESIGKA